MKIESNASQPVDTQKLDRLEKAAQGGQEAAAKTSAGSDQVKLSPEAQLAQAATAAVQQEQEPPIRQDVVDKMKALLDQGEIGKDPHKLADALISSWLNS